MKAASVSRRDRFRAQLADLKMPGALGALDTVLASVDAGQGTAADAIEALLGAQIALRNQRRLQAAMRSSRLPVVNWVSRDCRPPAQVLNFPDLWSKGVSSPQKANRL